MLENSGYSPILRQAAREIKEILIKYDIAGLISLHSRTNQGEYVRYLTPTYGNAKYTIHQGQPAYIFLNKLEHYGGDKKARNHAQERTANMLISLRDQAAQDFAMLDELIKVFEKAAKIERTGGDTHTPGSAIDN